MTNKNLGVSFAPVPALVALATVSVQTAWAQPPAPDRAALTEGVSAVYAPGALVGGLTLFDNTRAFTVLAGKSGKNRTPIVVASRAGRGRVVVYAHNGFLSATALEEPGTRQLLENAVRWSSNRNGALRVGLLDQAESARGLQSAHKNLTDLTPGHLTAQLKNIDVLVLNPGAIDGDADIAAVSQWVRNGGGLVTYGVGWGWQQLNPTKQLYQASFNRLLIPLAGVGVSGATSDPTSPRNGFVVDNKGLDAGDASAALTALEQASSGKKTLTKAELEPITRALSDAIDELPETDKTFLPRLKTVLAANGGASGVIPAKVAPIGLDKPAARLAAVLEAKQMARTPAGEIRAHPASATFPGAVPASAPRLSKQVVQVDTSVPDWHSTGLYVAPGEVVTVTVPANASGKGLGVRIGAHKDELWNVESWWRFPKITTETPIRETTLQVASPFGGTLFITVPDGGPGTKLGTVPVTVGGAVAQPYFVKGKTSVAEWKSRIRNNPAPWAELQGDRIILTVPSSAVRNLEDPEALMTYWDQVGDAAADLYSIPRGRKRQERYCVDVQISAGYMHSGYPIMTFDDVANTFTDLKVLRGTEGIKTWGFYHELGHNHQQEEWTWNGMGEVTNNLFSLYGNEKFNGVEPEYEHSHPAIPPKLRRDRLVTYLAKGPTPDGETADPWLALTMFIELRQAFGWEPFQKVFAEYNALGPGERPKTETDKHDQFMMRFSKAVGKNLAPYFTAWGLTTSESARQSLSSLPTWMPDDWPTAQEIAAVKADPKKVNNFGY